MASLRRDPRGFSQYWYACISVPGKGQTQRSTRIKATERNRNEAMAVAERWEREAKHLGAALHLENRDAVLETFVTATQKAVTGEMTEATAREMLDRILEATGQTAIQTETTRAFSERWLKAQNIGLAASSKLSYALAVRLFLEHLGSVADKPLRSVLPKHIEIFKAARIETAVSAKTVDRDLKVIRSIFRAGVKQGHLSFDPSQTVSLVSRKNKADAQTNTRETFRSDELDAILDAAQGDWRTAIFVARYTGARMGDCVKMRWSNFDLAADIIRYVDEKTGKNYAVPIHKRLREHLASVPGRDHPTKSLCPSLAGKSTGGCNGLSKQFQAIMAKAGVEAKRVESKVLHKAEGKKARTMARRSFHSIRHSYNTELANADVPQEIRRKLVGHADDATNDLYTHADISVFRAAINKLS